VIEAALAAMAMAGAPPPRPPAVGVGLLEWEVSVYRRSVPAGPVRLNVTNLGEDGHDLVVRTARGRVVKRLPELRAGARTTSRVTLRTPGRYVLFCSLAEHEELGMRTDLRVTRRR
jgi:hypothetical protein